MTDYKLIPRPFFILAPMDDVTDTVFRRVIAKASSPDLFFTEFVNADALQSPGRQKLIRKLRFDQSEKRLVAQIWGKNPESFYKTAKQIADGTFASELGLPKGCNFVGVDLNMGCPQKSEVSGGTCAALINDRPLALEIIQATKDGLGGKLPLSVKTRLGYNEIDLTWPELLLKQNINMLTIHGRTKREMSKVPAHWDIISEVRKLRDDISPTTLIVGNGDVMSKEQGLELANKYKLDGVMIGRGIFSDPFVFNDNSPWSDYSKEQKIDMYKEHVELFKNTWTNDERPVHVLNRFCKVYINGFDGAKEAREKLMMCASVDQLLQMLLEVEPNHAAMASIT